jgi:hypothetical protein
VVSVGLRLLAAAGVAAAACTGHPAPVANDAFGWPDWRGPAVHCRHLGDGGLAVELTAPTAGHSFRLLRVEPRGGGVDVVCAHALPTADVVAQVITPHVLEVPAAQLGEARAVAVHVTDADGATRLVLVTARP